MVRLQRLGRYAAIAMASVTLGCGSAAPVVRPVARAEPLPIAENQQGHAEPAVEAEADASEVGPLPPEQPSIAGVFLWCQSPTGRACALASAALGTGPKDPSGLPPSLLTVEDRSDDCGEPTIATLGARLSTAFSVQSTAWRDQGGTYLDLSTLGDMYQAAGCINDADPTHPIAKISAADGITPRVYLVRVWDGQAPTY